jgi:hypothetical protein
LAASTSVRTLFGGVLTVAAALEQCLVCVIRSGEQRQRNQPDKDA